MYYYTVKITGDGTEDNPFTPDYSGLFVWNPEFICSTCGTSIIATPQQTDMLGNVVDLKKACEKRGLLFSEVANWMVSGENK